jgi:uncharacterized protein YndB with AHSA1/START domain
METTEKILITVDTTVNLPVKKVWELWTDPKHIVRWNFANDDWFCPEAENELWSGGKFRYRMEAKDGSSGFDFMGTYVNVDNYKKIDYILDDGRSVYISFQDKGDETIITQRFEAEKVHNIDLQQEGWQAIMNNFKAHAESQVNSEILNYKILIDAGVEKVFKTMLGEETYRDWTSEFNPHSHYKGSWEKGSKIIFIGADENGNTGGMVSRIKENIHNRFVSIEHLGILKGDEEFTAGPEVESWAGALENYTFTPTGNKTLLSVNVDTNQEFIEQFGEMWPKALNRLKILCEK